MAEPLTWILNTSSRAAKVYAGLIEAADMDEKMWDFENIRKDHEQIVGDVKRTLTELGEAPPVEKDRRVFPDLEKSSHLRVYEDVDALKALLEAEKTELEDCRQLLTMKHDDRRVNAFVTTEVVPVLSKHVETLEHYLNRAQTIRH